MQSLTKLVWYLLCLYINLVEIQSFHIQLLNTCSRPDILPMGNQHWPSRWQTESILSASEHNDWYPPHPVSEQKGKKKQVLAHYLKQTDVCVYIKTEKVSFLVFTLLVFTAGSLAMTPVPEQGASSSTLSKPPMTLKQNSNRSKHWNCNKA